MNLPLLLLRRPQTWLIVAETMVVATLVLATCHVWSAHQGAARSTATAPSRPAPLPAHDRPLRTPAAAPPQPSASASPGAGPTTGLRTDPEFLARQMNELNRVESTFENLEWRVTRAVVDAIQSYIERVVLPSIEHTEKAAR